MSSVLIIGDNPSSLSILIYLRSDVELWILKDMEKKTLMSSLRELKITLGPSKIISLEVQGSASSVFELSGEKFDTIILAIPIYDLGKYLRQITEADLSASCLILPSPALTSSDFSHDLSRNRNILRAISGTVAMWEKPGSIKLLYNDKWYIGSLFPKNLQKSTRDTINMLFNNKNNKIGVIGNYNRFISYVWTYNILYSALFYPALILDTSIDFLVEDRYIRKIVDLVVDEGKRTARLHGVQISLINNDVYEFARKLRGVKSPVLYFWRRKLPSEVDYFNGAISRLSEERGEQATVNNTLQLIIKGLEAKLELMR